MVSYLLDDSQSKWDEEVLQDICNDRDRELIKMIPLSRGNKDDSWTWLFDENGDFSVKSCYRHILGEVECRDKIFWKKLWGLHLLGKMSSFLWRVCQKVLHTAVVLGEEHVSINTVCSWCQMYTEDFIHVLFQCDFAREPWNKFGYAEIVQVLPGDTVNTLLKRVFLNGSKDQNGMVGLLCWSLWYRRNNWVWNQINTSFFGVKSRAMNMLTDWKQAREEILRKSGGHQKTNRLWCSTPCRMDQN